MAVLRLRAWDSITSLVYQGTTSKTRLRFSKLATELVTAVRAYRIVRGNGIRNLSHTLTGTARSFAGGAQVVSLRTTGEHTRVAAGNPATLEPRLLCESCAMPRKASSQFGESLNFTPRRVLVVYAIVKC